MPFLSMKVSSAVKGSPMGSMGSPGLGALSWVRGTIWTVGVEAEGRKRKASEDVTVSSAAPEGTVMRPASVKLVRKAMRSVPRRTMGTSPFQSMSVMVPPKEPE